MLVRWDPLRDVATLHNRLDRLFEESLRSLWAGDPEESFQGSPWAPAVDILEKDNEIVLRADMPGLDPKDVDIQVQNGTLTVRGERKFEPDVKEDNFHRVERVYGSFVRSFSLPPTVDAEKVEAEYKNGVLEVKLPKRPKAKPKWIKVAVK